MPQSSWSLRWPLHPGLEASSRALWSARDDELTSREVAILLGMGAVAAVGTSLLDLPLRIPGHAILRTMLPLAVGFALVPRRHAGAVMSGGALFSLLILTIGGGRLPGIGSSTSLLLTGPLIDRAVRSARQGWQVHAAFALAGLASNTCAFLVRATPKFLGWDGRGGRSFSSWLVLALFSYAACGLVAGWLAGWIGFRASEGRRSSESEGHTG